jgi:protein TonB
MTGNEILRSNLLDIVFENRNKEYGAYALRKDYGQRLLLATSLSVLATCTLLYFIAKVASTKNPTVVSAPDGVIISTVALPELAAAPPLPAPSRPTRSGSAADRPFDIVEEVKTTGTDIVNDVALYSGPTGDVSNDLPHSAGSPGPATATEIPSVPQPAATEAPLITSAPSFPGGPEAWASFLQKNLRAPVTGEPGERTTVLVRFIVSHEGIVTGFSVVQSGGALLDNEVIRVLRKMPRWKPAISNGKSVPAAFTQPVTFQVNEQ